MSGSAKLESLSALLAAALRAAARGAREILDVYRTDFAVETKADLTPVTEADRRSEQAIREALIEADPSIPFLGEEGSPAPFGERRGWRRFWLVDPLDGTEEFARRNGQFTINIALIDEGRPALGVILAPVASVAYFGVPQAERAWRLDQAVEALAAAGDAAGWERVIGAAVALPCTRTSTFTIEASLSHSNEATEAYIEQCRRLFGEVEVRRSGSSLKMGRVAEGAADCYPRLGPTAEWDIAAGQAVVEAAGGAVLQAGSGEPLVYNTPELRNPPFVCVGARWRDRVPLA